ncbi:heterokaryon incompatibility protein-domain-containing protein [Hyaloscypha finlandica]|nr:heterokaryon incompatibility protein-domain-containing protein [Hyaloscypha finlandica]
MSISHTYQYEALANPSRQIRLLKLDTTHDNGSVLTGSLSVYKIPPRDGSRVARFSKHLQLPGYFALSYVWGTGPDRHPSHEIILDNRRFPITATLYAALHSYRSFVPASIRFWVDAICINQADDDEKSAQVPLMRDIYHLAVSVLVWLGDKTDEINRLELFISNLVNDGYVTKADKWGLEVTGTETKARDRGERKQPLAKFIRNESERLLLKGAFKGGMVQDEDFQAMATLLDKVLFSDTQYFDRMWTLQELCVANRGLVQVLEVDLEDLLLVFYYLQRTFNIRHLSFEKITTLFEINSKFNNGQRLPLKVLLALSAGRKSENPRDRIYGLHGLMKDEQNPLLKPDYMKPVAEVYANVARHIISTGESLDVICGHQLRGRLPELPSWVPDFRHFGLEATSLVHANGENIIYHASGSEKHALPEHPFQVTREWQTLIVTGIFLGNVSVLSEISVPGQDLQTETFALGERLWSAKLIQSQEWTSESQTVGNVSDLVAIYAEFYQNSNRATFWARNPDKLGRLRTMIGNANDQSDGTLGLNYKYFLTLLCGRIAKAARCSEEELSEHLTRSCIPDQEGIEILENLCKALDAGTQGRRLIMSEGKRMGAATEQTQENDMIYVLMGCSVPVILRKTARPNEFQFVGECYWHGFMDGEALAMRDGDKVTAHEFKLV